MMNFYQPYQRGQLEVICGPMFSGKSEELIRRLRRVQIAGQRLQIFKPSVDTRYEKNHIVSHSEHKLPATVVRSSKELLEKLDERTNVIGIDEVQFYDEGIVDVCHKLANMGKRVIVAGLDQDYLGHPFEPVPKLLAVAEFVTKTLAVCMRCGSPAGRTQRIVESNEQIVVGEKESYEARCRHCHEPKTEAEKE